MHIHIVLWLGIQRIFSFFLLLFFLQLLLTSDNCYIFPESVEYIMISIECVFDKNEKKKSKTNNVLYRRLKHYTIYSLVVFFIFANIYTHNMLCITQGQIRPETLTLVNFCLSVFFPTFLIFLRIKRYTIAASILQHIFTSNAVVLVALHSRCLANIHNIITYTVCYIKKNLNIHTMSIHP